ncbi:MAG: sporulation protein [Haloarculaceae archaeon]
MYTPRLLPRLGIGPATVDTRLPDGNFSPGETVDVTIEIEGWRADQPIDERSLAGVALALFIVVSRAA